jgi:hypothetical protein
MSVRSTWEFEYAPISNGGGDDGSPEQDLIISTKDDVDPGTIAALLASWVSDAEVSALISIHPVFWTRVKSSQRMDRVRLASALHAAGVEVRYIASARRGCQQLSPPLDMGTARPRGAYGWRCRPATSASEPRTPWRWFLQVEGVDIRREDCGTGAGTRLAVVDNDGRDLDKIDLDAEVLVNCDVVPRAGAHSALLMGWAVGARSGNGRRFRGVAPDASPRLYCIPKSSEEIFSLPLAIVQAAADGADVIVCSTYVDGLTSRLLDDALEFATKLGRGGRGSVVIMPTGREMSSPGDSIHSSLSLGLAEPASDPRVFCVGPSARDGGWFLWRDRRGRMRPFANRGPSIRWLAPGDDLAYPFASDDRPAHAESSGAAAVAAGVVLLVLGLNPTLELHELDQLLLDTIVPIDPAHRATDPELGDRADLLPLGSDPDGHNAKHGYGRLCASAACLAGSDPVCSTLIRIGELDAARNYAQRLTLSRTRPYSAELAQHVAPMILSDARSRHAFCTVARALRLMAREGDRAGGVVPGTTLRQLGILLRLVSGRENPPHIKEELAAVAERIRMISMDETAVSAVEKQLLEFVASLYRESVAERAVERDAWPRVESVGDRTVLRH